MMVSTQYVAASRMMLLPLLNRPLEKKLGEKYTCSEIVSGLRSMNFYEVKGEGYIPTYTRTDFADDLHDNFGFRTDFQIVNMKQMKIIFKDFLGFLFLTSVKDESIIQ